MKSVSIDNLAEKIIQQALSWDYEFERDGPWNAYVVGFQNNGYEDAKANLVKLLEANL